jgi:hypothetical protein
MAFQRALFRDVLSMSAKEGASSLTMQLARNSLPLGGRSLSRKLLKEMFQSNDFGCLLSHVASNLLRRSNATVSFSFLRSDDLSGRPKVLSSTSQLNK